jgi:M6 family metalloprotease-like protein
MNRFSAEIVFPSIYIIAVILMPAVFVPSPANAISARPGLYDPETGLSTTTGDPRPDFPEWYGKGLRSLRAVSGEGRAVALLIDFPDRPANWIDHPGSFFQELLFSQGSHPTGSFRDLYIEMSYGMYDVTGEAYGWYRTSEDYYTFYDDGYYGFAGGGRGVVISALLMADTEVDFGLYDSDGPDGIPNSGDDDGYVDACQIFHSGLGGHDSGDASDIWAHAGYIDPPYETNDPRAGGGFIVVEMYSIQPEITMNATGDDTLESCIAVVSHEYGHQLGLPDLYDGSACFGIGYWGLMGYGAFGALRTGPYHMSAWSKEQLGWVTPVIVTENMLDITIPPVEIEPVVYKVWRDGMPGEEYFLLENRQNIGFDTYLPGNGLLIWHVDGTMFGAGASNGVERALAEVGGSPAEFMGSPSDIEKSPAEGWYHLALEQADGLNSLATRFDRPNPSLYYPEMGDGADPFPGDSMNTKFDGYSNPSSHDNSGLETGVSIVDIALEGTDVRLSIVIDSSTVAVCFNDFRAYALDGSVELEWDVTADEAIEGFRIYRRGAGSGGEVSVAGGELLRREIRRYVDNGVRQGESYRYVVSAVKRDGSEVRSYPVEVSLRAAVLALQQNYPNPFNPTTTISFSLPEAAHVDLSIYDVEGRLVRMLINGNLPGGARTVEWDGRDQRGNRVGSGAYFCRLKAGKNKLVRKMVFLE